jgi:hypothetical protein
VNLTKSLIGGLTKDADDPDISAALRCLFRAVHFSPTTHPTCRQR